jgi:hypothetical protein
VPGLCTKGYDIDPKLVIGLKRLIRPWGSTTLTWCEGSWSFSEETCTKYRREAANACATRSIHWLVVLCVLTNRLDNMYTLSSSRALTSSHLTASDLTICKYTYTTFFFLNLFKHITFLVDRFVDLHLRSDQKYRLGILSATELGCHYPLVHLADKRFKSSEIIRTRTVW